MLCMKERFKKILQKIGRYMYKVGLFPGLSTIQFTDKNWTMGSPGDKGSHGVQIATKLLASKPGFSSHVAALETRCPISSFCLAALEELQSCKT